MYILQNVTYEHICDICMSMHNYIHIYSTYVYIIYVCSTYVYTTYVYTLHMYISILHMYIYMYKLHNVPLDYVDKSALFQNYVGESALYIRI